MNKENQKKKNVGFNLRTLFIMFNVAIIPLILYAYSTDTADYAKYPWYDEGERIYDMFYHAKCTWFSIFAVVMLIGIIECVIKMSRDDRKSLIRRYWPIIGYFVCIVVSFAFAIEPHIAFVGGCEQMEPVLVLIGYSLLSIYIYLNISRIKEIKFILYAFLFGTSMIVLIGIIQLVGIDFYRLPLIRLLIMNSKFRAEGVFVTTGTVVSTLGNQNYLGVYTCFVIPLVIALIFSKLDIRARIVAAADAIGLLLMLYVSGSKAGMITELGIAVVTVVFLGKMFFEKWKVYVPIAVAALVLFLILDHGRDWYIIGRIGKMLHLEKKQYELTEIDTTGDDLRIVYKGKELLFTVTKKDGSYFVSATEDGKAMEYGQSDDKISPAFVMDDGELLTIEFLTRDDYVRLSMYIGGYLTIFQWDLDLTDVKIMNASMLLDESVVIPNALSGYEYIATDRGYIWGVTIPRLKEFLLVGAGPDNFPFGVYLDGIDYANRYHSGCWSLYFTRPHNYYLQVGIDTGVLSLVFLLIFFVWYLIDCCRLYFWKKPDSSEFVLGFCSMLSVIAFLVCGLTNDSMIVTGPTFWTILGLGMVINNMVRSGNTEGPISFDFLPKKKAVKK